MRAWIVGALAVAGCGRLSFDPLATSDGSVATSDSATTADFIDTFDRPDQAGVGNGWIEHTPGIFSIASNAVNRVTGSDWTANHVYRPTSEDVDDLAVSIEVVTADVTNPDWPQIFVRGDTGQSGYYVWIEAGPSAASTINIDLSRQDRALDAWTSLDQKQVPIAAVGERYRLRLSAKGFNPVVLAAGYDKWTGTEWQTLVTLSAQDSDANSMASGHWGFSGHTLPAYTYDNYSMTRL